MKIYVAGPGSDWRTAKSLMRTLEENSHTITHDWSAEFENLENGLPIPSVPEIIAADLGGVRSADAVVFTFPYDHKPAGAWVEWGVAHERGKILVAYLHGAPREQWEERIQKRSIFLQVPGAVQVYSVEDLLATLSRFEVFCPMHRACTQSEAA